MTADEFGDIDVDELDGTEGDDAMDELDSALGGDVPSTSETADEGPDESDGVDEPSASSDPTETVDPISEPAFEYGEQIKQMNLYVREETVDEWEDVLFQVEGELRGMYGLKGITTGSKREVYDAMFRLLMEKTNNGNFAEELAEEIVAERRRQNG